MPEPRFVAYFDASARPRGTYCVAGYLYLQDEARKLNRELQRAPLRGRIFHAKDVQSGWGAFADSDAAERAGVVRQLVAGVIRRASAGIVYSCRPSAEVDWLRRVDGFKSPYSVCAYLCLVALSWWVRLAAGDDAEVRYVFEAGDKNQADLATYLERFREQQSLRSLLMYSSHSFEAKAASPVLATADLLAWEWIKYMEESNDAFGGQKLRPMRKSLAALLESPRLEHFRKHHDGEGLNRFLREINESDRQVKADVYAMLKAQRHPEAASS